MKSAVFSCKDVPDSCQNSQVTLLPKNKYIVYVKPLEPLSPILQFLPFGQKTFF